jgi:hypothetical protein
LKINHYLCDVCSFKMLDIDGKFARYLKIAEHQDEEYHFCERHSKEIEKLILAFIEERKHK